VDIYAPYTNLTSMVKLITKQPELIFSRSIALKASQIEQIDRLRDERKAESRSSVIREAIDRYLENYE
jgi:hypothetical protein